MIIYIHTQVQYSDWTGWGYAAYQGHEEVLKAYKDAEVKVDIDREFEGGITALIYAVRNQSDECIAPLIDMGANVNMQDSTGMTVCICICIWIGICT